MRVKVGFFGHNAPAWAGLTTQASAPFHDWDAVPPSNEPISIWKDTFKSPQSEEVKFYGPGDCFLERSVSGIVGNSWAVLEAPSKQFTPFQVASPTEASLVGFSLSAKTTGLELRTAAGIALTDTSDSKSETFKVRTTTAHVVSDRLTLAQLPIDEAIGAGTSEKDRLTLDRMVLNLARAQPIVVTGERADLPGVMASEIVILDDIVHSGGFTTLYFVQPGLMNQYVRKTVEISANVVEATHGESVIQVLGSGDAGVPNQGFVLRKPPLTYTASSDASGADSSLEIRVDGVEWAEAPRLFGLHPTNENYIVRHSDDGSTSVIVGDGVQGARLPTGIENVVARYRSGLGTAGMVRPNSLTLLMTRPLGIRDVTNPLAASGAADPEPRDEARQNAPRTVLTIDRVVSLSDAEDFARAFAGIGKCTARPLSRRGVEWIHLTIAASAASAESGPASGAMADHRLAETSPLRTNLARALAAASDPSMRIRLDTYQSAFFNVNARVLADSRFVWADVAARVTARLVAEFGFERRAFGQSVTVTEVVTNIQGNAGVVFVDLEALHLFDQPPNLPEHGLLVAGQVVWNDDDIEPSALARLLLVNPLGLTLTPISPESIT
jgi:predicted phage baseplate assembly protein